MKNQIIAETLSPEDIKSFKDVLNALVFNEPRDIEVSEESILEISSLIQNDFISGFNEKYYKFCQGTEESLKSLMITAAEKNPGWKLVENSPQKARVTKNFFDLDGATEDPKEILERVIVRFVVSDDMYNKISFTPKIMSMNNSIVGGLNCMGTNLLLGSFAKKLGLRVGLATTVEHPFLIVEIGSKTYLADGVFASRGLPEANGTWEHLLTHSVYYPYSREYSYSMAYVADFDRLLLYEILENFQALKEFFGGKKEALLPGYGISAQELLVDYKDIIQEGNWRKIQRAWFPEIQSYFFENGVEWEKEFWDHRKGRDIHYIDDLMSGECIKILNKTRASCGIKEEEVRDISNKISLFFKEQLPFLMKVDQHQYIKRIFLEEEPIPHTLLEKQIDFIETLICNLKEDENFRPAHSSVIAASLTEPDSFENIKKTKLIHINLKPWEYLEIYSEKAEKILKGLSLSEEKLANLKQELIALMHQ